MLVSEWTILYYASGRGGLSYQIEQDLAELSRVGSGDGVNFLCQYSSGRAGEQGIRFRMLRGSRDSEQELGDFVPGTSEALLDALRWSSELFPARRNGVVLMGHGSGWRPEDLQTAARLGLLGGAHEQDVEEENWETFINGREWPVIFLDTAVQLAADYSNSRAIFRDISGHSLDSVELGRVFREASQQFIATQYEFVGFDSCLMGCVEIASALAGSVNYLVASEQLEPSRGWPHDSVGAIFRGGSSTTETSSLLRQIPEQYVESYTVPIPGGLTLSVVDLTKIGQVSLAFRELSEILLSQDMVQLRNSFVLALEGATPFKADLWDIGTVFDCLLGRVTSVPLSQSLLRTKQTVSDTMVQFSKAGDAVRDAIGLSFYIPGYSGYSNYYDETPFSETGWGPFLRQFRPHRE